MNYIIKPMQTVDEIDGKGYVHYKSWQETYAGLIDPEYLKNTTEEKCKAMAYKWTDNILVAKDGTCQSQAQQGADSVSWAKGKREFLVDNDPLVSTVELRLC